MKKGVLPRVTKTGQVGQEGKKIRGRNLVSACKPHSLFQHWRKKRNQSHFVWAKWKEKDRSTLVWCPSSQETLDSFLTGQNGLLSRWPRYSSAECSKHSPRCGCPVTTRQYAAASLTGVCSYEARKPSWRKIEVSRSGGYGTANFSADMRGCSSKITRAPWETIFEIAV